MRLCAILTRNTNAQGLQRERTDKLDMLRNVYGTAFPLKVQIEEQILNGVQRLPGMPSSRLGAEALSGKLDDFDFTDALGQRPEESEIMQPDMHSVMEHRLGLSKAAPARELP